MYNSVTRIVHNGRGMSSGRMRTVSVSPDAKAGAEDDAKFYESAAIAYDRLLAVVHFFTLSHYLLWTFVSI
jgi:hypothetical protein